ncbi:MAG: ABC transporter ATP-binding protein, partial [Actinobacteria bacterium]|nr:ABC transporter ATP-binding protein [Actinomycetota bacterium]
DAPAIQWIAINGVTPFVSASVMLAGMIAVTVSIDWQLALIALAVSPVLVALTVVFRRRLRHGWTRERNLDSTAMSQVQEVLSSLRIVKA